jgi:hypothetical protein
MNHSARTQLINLYLDRVNNYLTDAVFAEHNSLSIEHATALLALAKSVFESKHPEE